MKLKIITIFAVLAVTSSNILDTEKNYNIYNSVIAGDYDYAIEVSKEIVNNDINNIYIIADTVTRLLNDGEPNLMNFAYKLVLAGEIDMLKNYFPIQFWLIFDNKELDFINKHDKLYLSLNEDQNAQGERAAFGDEYEENTWKLIPIWDNNKVHFKILNNEYHEYLKMGEIITDNDREVFTTAEAIDTTSQWFIQAAYYEDELLFFIFNAEYKQALKIGKDVESNDDEMVYGGDGDVLDNPEYFGWFIETVLQ